MSVAGGPPAAAAWEEEEVSLLSLLSDPFLSVLHRNAMYTAVADKAEAPAQSATHVHSETDGAPPLPPATVVVVVFVVVAWVAVDEVNGNTLVGDIQKGLTL